MVELQGCLEAVPEHCLGPLPQALCVGLVEEAVGLHQLGDGGSCGLLHDPAEAVGVRCPDPARGGMAPVVEQQEGAQEPQGPRRSDAAADVVGAVDELLELAGRGEEDAADAAGTPGVVHREHVVVDQGEPRGPLVDECVGGVSVAD